MAISQVRVNGLAGISKKLKRNAQFDDAKRVVRNSTAELTANMQAGVGKVLTGHREGKKSVKPIGTTKRSIVMRLSNNGFFGHTGPGTEYAPYLIHGTRFMVKRDSLLPSLKQQKVKLRAGLERSMKRLKQEINQPSMKCVRSVDHWVMKFTTINPWMM